MMENCYVQKPFFKGFGVDSGAYKKVIEAKRSQSVHSKSKYDDQNELVPLFFADIAITANRKERISVFLHDIPSMVANQFCKKHNLKSEMVTKLEMLIVKELKNIKGKYVSENSSLGDGADF